MNNALHVKFGFDAMDEHMIMQAILQTTCRRIALLHMTGK